MTAELTSRLNQILPRITAETFLSSEGIGKAIACYIFDYPAQEELAVRRHIEMMMNRLKSHHTDIDVLHLDLLDVVTKYLETRKLLGRALEMQASKGDKAVLRALRGPLAAEKIRDFIAEAYRPAEADLFLISGVGSVWPVLRAHSLLNCLHSVIGTTPLVMFYPGSFDGTTLRLFGRFETRTAKPGTNPYYRAIILIPGGTRS